MKPVGRVYPLFDSSTAPDEKHLTRRAIEDYLRGTGFRINSSVSFPAEERLIFRARDLGSDKNPVGIVTNNGYIFTLGCPGLEDALDRYDPIKAEPQKSRSSE